MISVVILTKNEEKNIVDCLESINWVDEIVVIDDFSTDRTLEVINNLNLKNIKIYKRHLDGDFSAQRNFAVSKAKYEWILFLDSDERVSSELREEINTVLIEEKVSSKRDGFLISRRDFMWNKMIKHGESGNIKLLRLGRKNKGLWRGKVHEVWLIENNISELDNYLLHYPHPTISEFLKEINFYTTLRSKELYSQKIEVRWYDLILYPKIKLLFPLPSGY